MSLILSLLGAAYAQDFGYVAIMAQAREALVAKDYKTAKTLITAAESVAPSSTSPVAEADLAKLWFYRGIIEWRTGNQDKGGMDNWRKVLVIAPQFEPDPVLLPETDAQDVLYALRGEVRNYEQFPTGLPDDSGDALIFIDGKRLSAEDMLITGRHLVQIRCGDGNFTGSWYDYGQAPADYLVLCSGGAYGGKGVAKADPKAAKAAEAKAAAEKLAAEKKAVADAKAAEKAKAEADKKAAAEKAIADKAAAEKALADAKAAEKAKAEADKKAAADKILADKAAAKLAADAKAAAAGDKTAADAKLAADKAAADKAAADKAASDKATADAKLAADKAAADKAAADKAASDKATADAKLAGDKAASDKAAADKAAADKATADAKLAGDKAASDKAAADKAASDKATADAKLAADKAAADKAASDKATADAKLAGDKAASDKAAADAKVAADKAAADKAAAAKATADAKAASDKRGTGSQATITKKSGADIPAILLMSAGGGLILGGAAMNFTVVEPAYAAISEANAHPGTMSETAATAWEGRFDVGRYSTIAMVGGGAALLATGAVLQVIDAPVMLLPNGIVVSGHW